MGKSTSLDRKQTGKEGLVQTRRNARKCIYRITHISDENQTVQTDPRLTVHPIEYLVINFYTILYNSVTDVKVG